MRRFIAGLAIGAAAGLAASRIPKVKQAMAKGQKKVKELAK